MHVDGGDAAFSLDGENALDFAPGARLGPWIVRAAIASGGFGRVFSAEHAESGQSAAVKVLRGELGANADAVARFEREAEALRVLDFPGSVKLYELGRLADGRPYLAMELLSGCDLKTWLARRGRLAIDDAVAILGSVCRTLGAAHAHGIVHRDIKASNVFLAETADGTRDVRVLDFGLAKILDDSGPALTASRQIIGTPASMAPEQILGGAVDERTDVYALGALLFTLLAGHPPFRHESALGLCQLHLHARVPNVSASVAVDPAVDLVIARAMSKEPRHRHASPAEFIDALGVAARSVSQGSEQRSVPVVLLSVAVRADPVALEAEDAGLLVDLEEILPSAREFLERREFRVALRTSDVLVAFASGSEEASARASEAARVTAIAAELREHLAARPRADPRVVVRLGLCAGTARMRGDRFIASDALELVSEAPDEPLGQVVIKSYL